MIRIIDNLWRGLVKRKRLFLAVLTLFGEGKLHNPQNCVLMNTLRTIENVVKLE